MKKLFNILVIVLAFTLIASTASALTVTGKFGSSDTTETKFPFGESDTYAIAAIISQTSPLLEIEVNLFRVTPEGPTFFKPLFSHTHTGSFVYSPDPFPLTPAEYEAPGSYFIDVKATETTQFGTQVIRSVLLFFDVEEEIQNLPPVANFTYTPQQPVVGDNVNFTSTSFDVDGEIVLEQWYFDNVLIHQFAFQGSSFTRTFSLPGTYAVRLVVTDDGGLTDEITRIITVGEGAVNVPPVANFTYAPQNPVLNDMVTFTSTSYDPDGIIVNERWFINGDLVHQGFNQTSFPWTLGVVGTYTVRLVVTDNDGLTDEITRIIVVENGVVNIPPVANFTYTPASPTVNQLVTFTSTSYDPDGIIVNERWFINGALVHQGFNQTSFAWTFVATGSYAVRLLVTDNSGLTDEITRTLVIENGIVNIPPVANFTYTPQNPVVDDDVLFTSTSYDPDGVIVNERWYINNALVHEGTNLTSFTWTFGATGTYNVRLLVTDNDGLTDEIIRTIIIENGIVNIPPVANFTYTPASPTATQLVTFTSTSYDPDGFITREQWFIDGSLVHEGTNLTSFTWTFSAAGTYSIRLLVTDNDGLTDEITRIITVGEFVDPNLPPIADFIYSPINPHAGQVITLTSTSYDPDGTIVLEEWDFNNNGVFERTGTIVQWTFDAPGIYAVRLRVTDNDGATATRIRLITVGEVPNFLPVAEFIYAPQAPFVGDQVTFTSTSYDPDGVIVNERWFIDGTLVHEGTNETSFTWTFTQPGVYSVRLIVTDNDGATAEVTRLITVAEPEFVLVAIIKGPESPFVGQLAVYDALSSYDTSGAEIVFYNWILTRGGEEVVTQASTNPYFEYTFTVTGRYQLTLIVTNEFGETAQTSMSIYAARTYGTENETAGFGEILSVNYHSVYGLEYGIVETDQYFTVSVSVTNRGSQQLNNLRTTFALPEFGLSDKSNSFSLRAGETRTVEFHTIIPSQEGIPLGYHDVLLGVAGSGLVRYNYFPMTLI